MMIHDSLLLLLCKNESEALLRHEYQIVNLKLVSKQTKNLSRGASELLARTPRASSRGVGMSPHPYPISPLGFPLGNPPLLKWTASASQPRTTILDQRSDEGRKNPPITTLIFIQKNKNSSLVRGVGWCVLIFYASFRYIAPNQLLR